MASNQHRERLREAAQFVKQGDHKSAQAIFRELIKASPRDAELWYLYSFAVTERPHQIKALDKALSLAPNHTKAKERLAQLRGDVPVPPRTTPKPTTPPYALLVGGGVISLVVLVLLIGFVLNRSQQSGDPLTTATQPPTNTVVIVTRKATETPTVVPTATQRPSRTPLMSTATLRPVPTMTPTSPLSRPSRFGGGTGRILYPSTSQQTTLNVIDLNDGTTSELAVVDRVEQAQWDREGVQLILSRESTACGSESQPCLSLMMVSTGAITPILNSPLAEFTALSPDKRQIASVRRDEGGQWALWIANTDGTNQRQLTETTSTALSDPVWSPDSRVIAYTQQGTIYVILSDGTGKTLLASGEKPSWSPDSTSLIYVAPDRSIFRINPDGQDERKVFIDDKSVQEVDWPIWSPDGQFIAFVSGSGLYVSNADGSMTRRVAEAAEGHLSKPSWQPWTAPPARTPTPTSTPTLTITPLSIEESGGSTGIILVYRSGLEVYALFNLRDKTISELALPKGVTHASWTEDGRHLFVEQTINASSCLDTTPTEARVNCIGLADVQNPSSVSLLPIEGVTLTPALSPDGSMVAFVGYDLSQHRQLWVVRTDGSDRSQITAMPDGIEDTGVQWTPDGRFITYVSTQGIHLIAPNGADDHLLIAQGTKPDWSPDGRVLAYVVEEGKAHHIYTIHADGTNRRKLTYNDLADDDNDAPKWSPDGRLILYRDSSNLYVMNVDGTGQRSIAEGQLAYPSWQPQPAAVPIATYTPAPTLTPRASQIIPTAVPASGSTVGGGTGHILYSAHTDGRLFFHTIDLNNKSISNETFPQDTGDVQWLPDGRRYLLSSRFGSSECGPQKTCLGLVDADSLVLHPLETLPPVWSYAMSPDMNQIAYVTATDRNLFVMDIDGSNVRQLTNYRENGLDGVISHGLAWSADGRFLAYGVNPRVENATPPRIDRVSREGLDEAIFLPAATMPVWSPDGSSLLYVSVADPLKKVLMVANADGSNPRQIFLGGDDMSYFAPAWSPDSRLIAFVYSVHEGEDTLYTADIESGVSILILAGPSLNAPSWQPLPSSVDTTLFPAETPIPLNPTLSPLVHGPKDFTVPSGTGHVIANLNSPTGDFIGQGQGAIQLEGEGRMDTSGWDVSIDLVQDGGTWSFDFFAPYLEVGKTYDGAGRMFSVSNEGPSMDVSGPSRSCNSLVGDFTIEQITPEVVIDFSQSCDGRAALIGTLIFQPD